MNKEIIPEERECFRLIEEYEMLPNIIEHSKKVRDVSVAIINDLKDTGYINRNLVIAAALLHDIAKTMAIKNNDSMHDIAGGRILRKLNYSSIADIVESHIFVNDFNPSGKLEEREIVYYADKRVKHDRIVTINERIKDIVERYCKTDRDKVLIYLSKNTILSIEKKIQGFMKNNIDKVISHL